MQPDEPMHSIDPNDPNFNSDDECDPVLLQFDHEDELLEYKQTVCALLTSVCTHPNTQASSSNYHNILTKKEHPDKGIISASLIRIVYYKRLSFMDYFGWSGQNIKILWDK